MWNERVLARQWRFLVLVIGLLVLAACERGPTLQPLATDSVILAFGDSLTEGKGVTAQNSYPTVLSALTGRRVVNAGISGEITAEGLDRLPEVLDSVAPQLVVLLHGGNDILRNLDVVEARANLDAMIREIRGRGIAVVLVGVPEKRLFADSASLYGELAASHALPFDGEIIGELIRSPSMKSDSVHFNREGYQRLAESVHRLLDNAGAL